MSRQELGEGVPEKRKRGRPRVPDDKATPNSLANRRSRARKRGENIPFQQRGRPPLPDDQIKPSTRKYRRRLAKKKR